MQNYVVFARKYRPQNFNHILGQEHITTTLLNSIKLNKIAHAYLFSGPQGVGKTTTARILAKSLNCPDASSGEPCNKCIICKEITQGTSLDVVEIDGASNRGIDEIRQLQENIRASPVNSRFRVYIIDEVHMLTEQAFNALLKTLEEPPPHVIFIFATTAPQKLPLTILSRCQRFGFRSISEGVIFSHLRYISQNENIKIDEEALRYISRVVDGSLRDAEVILEQAYAYSKDKKITTQDIINLLGRKDKDSLLELLNFINAGDINSALKHFYRLLSDSGNVSLICLELMEVCRDIILYKADVSLEYTSSYLQHLSEVVNRYNLNELLRLFNGLRVLHERLRYFPNQAKIIFDIFIVRFCLTKKEKKCKEIDVVSSLDISLNKDISLNEIKEIFNKIKSKIKEEKPSIYSSISLCNIKEFKDNKLILEICGGTNFDKNLLQENIPLLTNYIKEYIKNDKMIEIIFLIKDIKEEQQYEMFINKIVEIFDGRIKEDVR